MGEARREPRAELAEADAAHSVVTRTAAKGHLLGLLDVLLALRAVHNLPNSLKYPLSPPSLTLLAGARTYSLAALTHPRCQQTT